MPDVFIRIHHPEKVWWNCEGERVDMAREYNLAEIKIPLSSRTSPRTKLRPLRPRHLFSPLLSGRHRVYARLAKEKNSLPPPTPFHSFLSNGNSLFSSFPSSFARAQTSRRRENSSLSGRKVRVSLSLFYIERESAWRWRTFRGLALNRWDKSIPRLSCSYIHAASRNYAGFSFLPRIKGGGGSLNAFRGSYFRADVFKWTRPSKRVRYEEFRVHINR